MRIPSLISGSSCLGVAALVLGACGGSQAPTGSTTFTGAQGRNTGVAQSRLPQNAKKKNTLLYVTDGCGGTCVLSYPDGQLVGSLSVGAFYNAGACTDSQGDVFISNDSSVVEYAHGGTNPIATFNLPGNQAKGCAVDATTGDLAVVFTGSNTNVAIFKYGSQTPSQYSSNLDSFTCVFDSSGNLFVAGLNDQQPELAELPSGGNSFNDVMISGSVGLPGQLEWDGGYLTYESVSKRKTFIYRLSISGSIASVAGKTHLIGPTRAYNSWIYGARVLVPYTNHGPDAKNVGLWKYPQGGKMLSKFSHFGGAQARFQSVAVSVKP